MAEATRESKNIVEYPVIPVVKPVTGKRGITPHILPGEKADSLFPFLRAVNKETILFIGSASSFFFAGTTGEFFKLRNQIEDTLKIQWMKTKARDGRTEPFLPFEKGPSFQYTKGSAMTESSCSWMAGNRGLSGQGKNFWRHTGIFWKIHARIHLTDNTRIPPPLKTAGSLLTLKKSLL